MSTKTILFCCTNATGSVFKFYIPPCFKKKPSKPISAELDNAKTAMQRMTFKTAAGKYVEMKENVLSPKTVKECSELSKDKAPKTVHNYHGYISAVLGTFRPQLKINTTLPQKKRSIPHIPSTEEVQKILKELSGTEYEIPVLLSCYGMRRSEICALTVDDIEGDVVHITKAMVQDKDNK